VLRTVFSEHHSRQKLRNDPSNWCVATTAVLRNFVCIVFSVPQRRGLAINVPKMTVRNSHHSHSRDIISRKTYQVLWNANKRTDNDDHRAALSESIVIDKCGDFWPKLCGIVTYLPGPRGCSCDLSYLSTTRKNDIFVYTVLGSARLQRCHTPNCSYMSSFAGMAVD